MADKQFRPSQGCYGCAHRFNDDFYAIVVGLRDSISQILPFGLHVIQVAPQPVSMSKEDPSLELANVPSRLIFFSTANVNGRKIRSKLVRFDFGGMMSRLVKCGND